MKSYRASYLSKSYGYYIDSGKEFESYRDAENYIKNIYGYRLPYIVTEMKNDYCDNDLYYKNSDEINDEINNDSK